MHVWNKRPFFRVSLEVYARRSSGRVTLTIETNSSLEINERSAASYSDLVVRLTISKIHLRDLMKVIQSTRLYQASSNALLRTLIEIGETMGENYPFNLAK